MFGRQDLNAWLGEFLAEHADAILGGAGFRRRAGARSARRKTGYGAQKIEFFAYSRPSYAPGQAHLVMMAWFYMPEVMRLARQVFGPSFTVAPADPGLAGGADLDSLRQREPLGLWLFADQAQLRSHAPQVQQALRRWVLPFLDASSSLEAFASGPAREHLRVEVVAAAYLQLGQPGSALRYLQQRAAAADTGTGLLTPAPLLALDTLTAYLTDNGQGL
jgi:hypothetical protein